MKTRQISEREKVNCKDKRMTSGKFYWLLNRSSETQHINWGIFVANVKLASDCRGKK